MTVCYDVDFWDRYWRSLNHSKAMWAADVLPIAASTRYISNGGCFWFDDCELP